MYWNNDWTGFFLVYFKWCYYLCVTPFRFEYEKKTKKYLIKRNPIQMVLCAIQYILLGFWYLKDLRKIPVDSLYKNPVVYFSLAFNLNAIYYHCGVLAVSYWRHDGRYLALVNFDCEGYAPSTGKKKLLAVFLCFLFAILSLMYSLYGYQVIPSSRRWDAFLLFRCLVAEGRFAFFLNGTMIREPCNNNNPPEFSDLSYIDFVVALLAFLMEVARQILGFYSDFFPLICSLSLWTSIGAMREFLEDDPLPSTLQLRRLSFADHVDEGIAPANSNKRIILPYITHSTTTTTTATVGIDSTPVAAPSSFQLEKKEMMEAGVENVIVNGAGNFLLERYETCKAFSRTMNRALGQLLFAYVLSSIMYLSTCMDAVLVLQDWFGRLRVAFFFSIFILMFFVGSETVNKVYGLRAWLSEPQNNAFIPEKNLLVLIHEVTHKSIGVCGNGMFTITYSTFMTVMTTTVTFFIIILQFQKPDRENVFMSNAVKNLVLDQLPYLLVNISDPTLKNKEP